MTAEILFCAAQSAGMILMMPNLIMMQLISPKAEDVTFVNN